ncbi:MAG: serine hydrolase domain-containing protein [Tateyamaria sp.]|uniref:serine hydrolase domain-containing protein n=1 Tax=Tateyamaria sp. TaxID=1929288 RepID=UPI00329CA25C
MSETRMTLDAARLERIRDWADTYIAARRFAGMSVLILQEGQEVFFDARAVRDVEDGLPFARDTVARIYSMTKPITSLALMTLVEEGRLHLDAPVSRFLPEFSDPHALIPDASDLGQTEPCPTPTLHQILTHRSGLSYAFNPGLVPQQMAARDLTFAPRAGTLAQTCEQLAQLPLAFAPGARWEYSVGIDVIGRVIEVVTGRSLAEVFQTRIFDPLGMAETGFTVAQSQQDRFASLYTPLAGDAMDLNSAVTGDESLRLVDDADNSPFLNPTCLSGGGGLVGTIDDYARFAEAMRMGGQGIVSRATAAFMMQNHLPGDIASLGPSSFAEQPMRGVGFGIGGAVVLDAARSGMPGSVGDFSWGGMASTFFWIDPVHALTTVLFTQLSPSSATPARAELKALVHGALM